MVLMNGKNIRYGTRRKKSNDKKTWKPGRKTLKQLAICSVAFFICTPIAKTETGMKSYISNILVNTSDIEQARAHFNTMCCGLENKHPKLADNAMWKGFMAFIDNTAVEKPMQEKEQSEPQTPQEALELVAKASPNEFVYPDTVTMVMPLNGEVTSPFGGREHPISGNDAPHNGVDIAGNFGDPIISTAPGKVLKVGFDEFSGNYLIIQHTESMKSHYAHCQEIHVIEGEIVDGNTLIASVGSTGISTGPHLHFEIRVNDESVNPEDYIVMKHRQ